jgi:hypothetical protein
MSTELLQAVLTLYTFCLNCDNCKTCPLRNICGKQPAEWLD